MALVPYRPSAHALIEYIHPPSRWGSLTHVATALTAAGYAKDLVKEYWPHIKKWWNSGGTVKPSALIAPTAPMGRSRKGAGFSVGSKVGKIATNLAPPVALSSALKFGFNVRTVNENCTVVSGVQGYGVAEYGYGSNTNGEIEIPFSGLGLACTAGNMVANPMYMGKRLASIARSFEKFKFLKFVIRRLPLWGTNSSQDEVAGGFMMDPTDAQPDITGAGSGWNQVMLTSNAHSVPSWRAGAWSMPIDDSPIFYIYSDDSYSPTVNATRNLVQGVFVGRSFTNIVPTTGSTTNTPKSTAIYVVDYEVKLEDAYYDESAISLDGIWRKAKRPDPRVDLPLAPPHSEQDGKSPRSASDWIHEAPTADAATILQRATDVIGMGVRAVSVLPSQLTVGPSGVLEDKRRNGQGSGRC